MHWIAEVLGRFLEKPTIIGAFIICFCFWAWMDHSDKRYLVDTIHQDLQQIEIAIGKNTDKVDQMLLRLAELYQN